MGPKCLPEEIVASDDLAEASPPRPGAHLGYRDVAHEREASLVVDGRVVEHLGVPDEHLAFGYLEIVDERARTPSLSVKVPVDDCILKCRRRKVSQKFC